MNRSERNVPDGRPMEANSNVQNDEETKMNKVDAQILIDAPVQSVWEVLADFGAVYQWAPSVTQSYSTSEISSGPEASRHCDISGFGGIEEDITEWNDGSDFTYRASGVGPISGAYSTWSVKAQGGQTMVSTDFRYGLRFGPLGSLMNAVILRRKLKQGLGNALEGLKHHVKTGEQIETDFRAPMVA